jgi:zinc transporter ZupT
LLALVFASLGSVGAVIGAAGVLLAQTRSRVIVPWLVSYATGTLLGGALLGLVPEALEREEPTTISAALLGGILVFFVLEKVVLWRHCHQEECDLHTASGELILLGDAVHNLMDGVVIGAAFATDTSLGITASIAVIAHEASGGWGLRDLAEQRVQPDARLRLRHLVVPHYASRRACRLPVVLCNRKRCSDHARAGSRQLHLHRARRPDPQPPPRAAAFSPPHSAASS